jgi:hypothetical protein
MLEKGAFIVSPLLCQHPFGMGKALLWAGTLAGLASDAFARARQPHDHPPILVIF